MREIKFRAWDKIDNRMSYENNVEGVKEWPSLLAIGFHGLPICIDGDSFKENEIIGWNRDHNLILMQYTGLKDKNGKEIYEGDIYKRYDSIFVVIFDEFGFKCKKVYDSWLEKNVYKRNEISLLSKVDSDYCYEVIGNIYENPELLQP